MSAVETVEALRVEVERIKTVDEAAIAALNGIQGRIQAAVDAALAGGATTEQVAAMQALSDDIKGNTDRLAAAIVANTPAE